MKGNFKSFMLPVLLLFAFTLLGPKLASATPVTTVHAGQVVDLSQLSIAGDVVLCDPGWSSCNANTPRADIAGVGVFYNLAAGPYTPDEGVDANAVTFLTGSQLSIFLNDYPGGFSPNATFMDASANGMTPFETYVFDAAPSSTTPEPGTLALFGIGLLGLAAVIRRHATAA